MPSSWLVGCRGRLHTKLNSKIGFFTCYFHWERTLFYWRQFGLFPHILVTVSLPSVLQSCCCSSSVFTTPGIVSLTMSRSEEVTQKAEIPTPDEHPPFQEDPAESDSRSDTIWSIASCGLTIIRIAMYTRPYSG